MKILILAERFYPEEFLINDLAAEWKQRGYQVEVLTQAPSYPHDQIYEGYKNRAYQTTREYHGIPVHRVRTVLGYNTGMRRKILNYISFAFWTSLWALFNGWRYDRVFTFHSGPLTVGAAGIILRFIWWRKCMIWTQDLWPDTVYSYGVKPTFLMKTFLNLLVRVIYKAYPVITVSCPGFVKKLEPYTRKKVFFFPQWTTQNNPLPPRKQTGKLVFTFAGNVGSVQNLEHVVHAFGELRLEDVRLRILGGGIYLERLRELVKTGDYRNVELPGRKPQAEMPDYFADSDVLIISLKPEFDLTVPAKFQAYLAAGRPVLGLIRGDTAKLIEEHDLGLTADPGDEGAIAQAFITLSQTPTETFVRWRKNALALSQSQFDRTAIINDMTGLLLNSYKTGEK